MLTGLLGGVLWAMDTVVLGIALAMTPFVETEEAVFLAPFVSTFLHDFFSTIWMLLYMGVRKQYKNVVRALKTKSGKFIMVGALLGGPIGMSGYVASINYIGPAYTAIISALYPAVGVLLSYIFLKEKMKIYQLLGLACSIGGVIGLSYTPGGGGVSNLPIGIACALLCVVGWGTEAVICAYGMKDPNVSDEQALQIRQATSAIFYGIIILPVLGGVKFAADLMFTEPSLIILAAAFFGTTSYLCYYRAINRIGPSKALPLNITYTAWSIVFSILLLHTLPDMKSVVCGIIVVAGSLVAACDFSEWHK